MLLLKLPLFLSRVAAGFPSPADDYVEKKIDLNKQLIKNPAATFFVKVEGDSMVRAGIFSGDMLVVDRSAPAKNGAVVLAVLDGEMTVKRLRKEKDRLYLTAENQNYAPIEILPESDFEIWGVVLYSIHSLSRP
jgi:DNA polymerase V